MNSEYTAATGKTPEADEQIDPPALTFEVERVAMYDVLGRLIEAGTSAARNINDTKLAEELTVELAELAIDGANMVIAELGAQDYTDGEDGDGSDPSTEPEGQAA